MIINLHYVEANSLIKYKITERLRFYPALQFTLLADHSSRFRNTNTFNIEYKDPTQGEVAFIAGANYRIYDRLSLDLRFTGGWLRLDSSTPPNFVMAFGLEYDW